MHTFKFMYSYRKNLNPNLMNMNPYMTNMKMYMNIGINLTGTGT